MNTNNKQLIYISGPPCAGKSTFSKALLKKVSPMDYVMGDDYWNQNEGYDFGERIEKTNGDIIASLESNTSNKLLVEWVPSIGWFIDSIRGICERNGYEFIHILLMAPTEVLESRKLRRDGNKALGPIDMNRYATLKNVQIFDTNTQTMESIVEKCISLIK